MQQRNHSNIYKEIGKNIQKYRKLRNLTQEELAQKTHLSYGYIKNLEAKNVNATISIETLYGVADVLEVELIDLLHEEKNINDSN